MATDKKTPVKVAKITAILGGVALVLAATITGVFGLLKPSASPSQNQAVAQSLGLAFAGSQVGTLNVYNNSDNATRDAVAALDRRLSNATTTLELTTNEVRLLSRALKDLDERTSAIEKKLPDGLTEFGGIVGGEPSVLQVEYKAAYDKFTKKSYAGAFEHLQRAIIAYESSPDGAAMTTTSITPTSKAALYTLGAQSALIIGKNELGYDWAKKAFAVETTWRTRAPLSVALMQNGRVSEAKKVIEEGLKTEPKNEWLLRVKSLIEEAERGQKR